MDWIAIGDNKSHAEPNMVTHKVGIALSATLLACGLAGCAVGPNYRAPQPDVPAQWNAATDARPLDALVLAQWWKQFNDPLLNALVTDALEANLDLGTARAQLREARARRDMSGARLGPSLDGSLSGSSSKPSGSESTRKLFSAGFDASWEPDIFGGVRRGVEAASADVDASTESLRDTRVSLAAEVVLNYVDLRTTEQRLTLTENSIAARSETYELTQWRAQAGLVSELDVAQSRTELESARAALPALRTAITGAQNRLAVLLGRSPGALQMRLNSNTNVPPTVPLAGREAAVGIPAAVLHLRPDVRTAERRLAAQTARLGEAEAARYPSFRLSGSIGLEALTFSSLGDSGTDTRSLLGGVTAPIFHSGSIIANIEVQNALLEQARLTYEATVLAALEDVENALVGVVNADQRRTQLALATSAGRETLTIAEHRYASGLIDFLAVLDSQRTLLNLEDQLSSSTGEVATSQIKLYKALGGGWSPTEDI
ncbi:MAG: efflux transporter outer membrane subunit [Desulfuromonadaceae bacterium]|nr:efflux transporter outer membrane subunit [Desulfuromonadaceae bacterium]